MKLLENDIKSTFIVSNCDVIVKADYNEVLKHHKEQNALITVLSSIQHYSIPYGVIDYSNGGLVSKIIEKPEYSFNVNTGVYLLEADVFDYIPNDSFFNMTDLIQLIIDNNKKVSIYPVNENDYIDIGQWDEYKSVVKKMDII